MRQDWWNLESIVGYDEPGDDEDDEGGEETDTGDEEDESEDESGEEEKKPDENVSGLKSALRKERMRAKKAERELKKLQNGKADQDTKDQSEKDKALKERDAALTKSEKLAQRLLKTEMESAIIKAAGKHNFRDLDDVLKLVDREQIEVDQDDDDPSTIEIDDDSVKSAVKKLADDKPHLLVADGDGEPSGSKFGGRKKSKDPLSEEVLKERYSALR
jgi:hypothetical protein